MIHIGQSEENIPIVVTCIAVSGDAQTEDVRRRPDKEQSSAVDGGGMDELSVAAALQVVKRQRSRGLLYRKEGDYKT